MSVADVVAADVVAEDNGTLAVPPQARTTALAPVTAPRPGPADRETRNWVEAGRLEGRYWRAVTRYLGDYRESQEDGPAYRSPAKAAEAAARLRADAEAAARQALRAQRDTQVSAGRLGATLRALEGTPAWQWRVRSRLRAEALREDQRRAAALRDLDDHSARMERSLRRARHAERIAAVLRRSDRAHLAAAEAASRALGWRPGGPLPSHRAVYVAGSGGVEPLPAIAQR